MTKTQIQISDRVADALPKEPSRGVSEQSLPKKEQPEETLMETLTETQHNETLTEADCGTCEPGHVIQLHA